MILSCLNSLEELLKACPACHEDWIINYYPNFTHYRCHHCQLDSNIWNGSAPEFWLRKNLTDSFAESKDCLYWTNYAGNLYFDNNGIRHDINKDIFIPLDITQQTLETIIHFQ